MEEKETLPKGWTKLKSKSRPDKSYYYHVARKISVWKLEDLKKFENNELPLISSVNGKSKTPKKSPTKQLSKISNNSKVIVKKNLAEARLKKLQNVLKEEIKIESKRGSGNSKDFAKSPKKSSLKKDLSNGKNEYSKQSHKVDEKKSQKESYPKLEIKIHQIKDEDEDEKMEMDVSFEKSDESQITDVEPMEWEEIDEKEVVKKVQNLRSKECKTTSVLPNARSSKIMPTENEFYIIIDTNVLLSNLSFVQQIKGKVFKDIGKANIFLPYVVLCELDKLKTREENIARLARKAIYFIDQSFKCKDAHILGQSAIESSRELITVDSGDDSILNSALQIKEITKKTILLSNDRNLRNKAFVSGIESFSSDMLNYADYNVSNTIKFDE